MKLDSFRVFLLLLKVGFSADLLGITFIILRLVGVMQWNWLWVLGPFWMSVALMSPAFLWAMQTREE